MPCIEIIPQLNKTITIDGATFTNVKSDTFPTAIYITEATQTGIPAMDNVIISAVSIVSSESTSAPIRIESSTAKVLFKDYTLPLDGFYPACQGLFSINSVQTVTFINSKFTRTITSTNICTNVLAIYVANVVSGSLILRNITFEGEGLSNVPTVNFSSPPSVLIDSSPNVQFENCVFTNIVNSNQGASIYVINSVVSITGSTITSGHSFEGQLYATKTSNLTISDTTFSNNQADGSA